MLKPKKRAALLATGVAVALTLTACGGSAGSKNTGGGSSASNGPQSGTKGGTVFYLTKRAVEHWDPQRVYIGRDIADASRIWYRTLVQFASGAGPESNTLVPDLATNTGTMSDGGKTWKFTLKSGVKWQDGQAVTCDQVKYGISRTFATDVITGGPNYAIQFLDIPTKPDGSSTYDGPYKKDGQADFDKAITCSGQDITFKLSKPVTDFNYAVTLPAFGPYRQDQDQGANSNYAIFSDGPYMLQSGSTWQKNTGGTFVRNPNYDPGTDQGSARKALPDKFTFVEGLAVETIFDRLKSDSGDDKFAVTDRTAPPAYIPQVLSPQFKDRATNPTMPFVDYLIPNFKKLTNQQVRQALAVATDVQGYIAANGGSTYGDPATSIINPAVKGYAKYDAFGTGGKAQPDKAKQLLQQAGVPQPFPINFAFQGGTPTTEAFAAALKAGWEKAGFAVTLTEMTDTYYDVIQNPTNSAKYDVMWAGWGADWPNSSTVIPPLFDSRINLTSASTGQDYGYYDSPQTNQKIDAAYNETDLGKQAQLWGDLDQSLQKEGAYIPLTDDKNLRLHGSGLKNYVESASTNGYPDLGVIGAA